MDHSHRVGTAVVALLTVVAVIPGVGLGVAVVGEGPSQATPEAANATGVQLATVAGTTASQANESVDAGMWEAAFERSEDKATQVSERADVLAQRLERLQNLSAELAAARENGTVPEPAYNARAASIQTRIEALRTAINETRENAARVGVNASQLERLRTEARNLSGPEVAAIARNLTDGGPPATIPGRSNGTDAGPPSDPGPPEGTDPPGADPPTNRSGTSTGTAGPPGSSDGGSGNGSPPDSGGAADGGSGQAGSGDGGSGGNQPTDAGPPTATPGAGASIEL